MFLPLPISLPIIGKYGNILKSGKIFIFYTPHKNFYYCQYHCQSILDKNIFTTANITANLLEKRVKSSILILMKNILTAANITANYRKYGSEIINFYILEYIFSTAKTTANPYYCQ